MKQSMKLKMAVIMDEFTYSCYAPECDVLQLTPYDFKQEIDGFEPDLLFIESVWRGKDNLWRFKLHDNMEHITALCDYCHKKQIPIVFWSKEDPVHFGVFIRTAALADYVFTTDADCIELYKAHLGHNRVYYLPFAAQPAIHNPMEEYKRKDKFCFAGSFYVKYKERSKVFMDLAPLFLERGLDIYDRNYKKSETDTNTQSTSVASPVAENYYFPPELQDCILGGLPYSEISRAYKGYKYGINMTSMVYSGFMFARRVFELLACNTVTVSNYSRGLEAFFGDLIISTNDRDYMRNQLDRYCGDDIAYRKYRLAGLRHVLKSHLYEDRLELIAQKALNRSIHRPLPRILVVCRTKTARIQQMFDRQCYNAKLLMEGDAVPLNAIEFDYVTVFSDNDYYGKNYLLDFALATRFSDEKLIGKAAYYSGPTSNFLEKAYTRTYEGIHLQRQMVRKDFFDEAVMLKDLFVLQQEAELLSLDEFNYCENYKGDSCTQVDDIEINTGVSLEEIYAYTDQISPVELKKSKPFPLEELFQEVQMDERDHVKKYYENGNLSLLRDAEDDEIVWLRTAKNFKISDYTTGSRIGFFTRVSEKTGNVRCQIEYYDQNNKKLDFLNFALDGFSLLRISDHAVTFKLIFRMRGKASVTLTEMCSSSPNSLLPAPFPLKSCVLITEDYPDYAQFDKLRNVHAFVKENDVEVLLVGSRSSYLPYSEFEGVQIVSTRYDAIGEYLSTREFGKIFVYSPSEELKQNLLRYQVIEL